MARILASDRILEVGSSGFGKSTHAAYLFHCMVAGGSRFLMVDPKAEWIIEGAVVCRTPEQLAEALAKQGRAHYVPSRADRQEWEAVYEQVSPANGAHDVVVWTDECQNVCVGGANWAPHGLKLIQTQGRFHRVPHIACSTRPVDVEKTLRTEATHIMVFAGGLDADDLDVIAKQLRIVRGADGKPLIASLDELQHALAQLADYGYLWFDRRQKTIQACPPLPEEHRQVAARTARQRT